MFWKMVALTSLAVMAHAQQYDLLIRGGHVIDPKNKLDAVSDVAIAGGKIALVAQSIPAEQAKRIVNATGLIVTPGLIDIHAHLYAGTGMKGVYTGDWSVYPDGFSFRTGLTTMVDAGTAGDKKLWVERDSLVIGFTPPWPNGECPQRNRIADFVRNLKYRLHGRTYQ